MSTPYEMKDSDKDVKQLVPTIKAFDNGDFLRGDSARVVRILCEFQEPGERLKKNEVMGTILFFGSARSMAQGDYDKTMNKLKADHAAAPADQKGAAEDKVERFKKVEWMCEWADKAEQLSAKLTEWSMNDEKLKSRFVNPDYLSNNEDKMHSKQPLVVTTGGGPGIMEAANRGAASIPGAKTMGMGISLPFEKGLNPYVTKDLAFEFHYFFTRKFWMMYSCKALIIGPGGFGTMDELFELLTLRQTGKIPEVVIVLLCSKFWKTVINWQALADFGTISQAEVDRLCFADDVETAFEHIKNSILPESHPEVSPAKAGKPQQGQALPADLPKI